jgi:hypothetical protein
MASQGPAATLALQPDFIVAGNRAVAAWSNYCRAAAR